MSKGSKYKSDNRPKFKIWDNETATWYKPIHRAYAGEIEELLLSPSGDLNMRKYGGVLGHESLFPDRFEVVPITTNVKVPDCVAKWFEENSDNLERSIRMQVRHGLVPLMESRSKFDTWFFDESNHPIETLFRMKNGYEVEQELKYHLVLPHISRMNHGKPTKIHIVSTGESKDLGYDTFTEKEIKSIDERYWAFAVPVEEDCE